VALFQKACNAGLKSSCYHLGVMLVAGRGAPRDEARARALFEKECAWGEEEACARLPTPR
jgi:TPR repeat protein